MDGSSAQYLSCNVFRDWSIVKLWEINHIYKKGIGYISLLHFLKQHLSAFADLLVWIRKGPRILVFFQWNFLSYRVPTFRGQNAGHWGISFKIVY